MMQRYPRGVLLEVQYKFFQEDKALILLTAISMVLKVDKVV